MIKELQKQQKKANSVDIGGVPSCSNAPDQRKFQRPRLGVGLGVGSSVSLTNMTIPPTAKRFNNKWDPIISKMAETKHRPINVKDVKSKVYNTKVIPSHLPPTGQIITDSKISKINTKIQNNKNTTRNNKLPKLVTVKETFSSQSSTLSSSSEEQQQHHSTKSQSRLIKQNSSKSSTSSSTGTVIAPIKSNSGSKTTGKCGSSPKRKDDPNGHRDGGPVNFQEIQNLRTQLNHEREIHRTEIESIKAEYEIQIKAIREANDAFLVLFLEEERRKFQLELETAKSRLQDLRSDFEREREKLKNEFESKAESHIAEIQSLIGAHGAEMESLKESHHLEMDAAKISSENDLTAQRIHFNSSLFEHIQRNEFEMVELKAKHEEAMDNLESQYKLEIELLKQKIKDLQSSNGSLSSSRSLSKENSVDLLSKEITSLKVVIDLRNNEIRDLKQERISSQLRLDELHGVVEKNLILQRRVEDLEAQVQKTRDDRNKLLLEHKTMESSMHEAISAKDKLSMELECIRYRMETTGSPCPSPGLLKATID